MVRVGQISYAMYLWHYPIVAVLRGALAPRAGLWAATVASAIATVVVAWLSGIVVERPARRWITARLMPAQPARSARAVGIASSNSAI
jgi:peptidoglycan/LPS O-acetylase OafA/YrhL